MSVNKVIIVGRLGQNPEVRYAPSGSAVANFSVATSESWTDKQNQKQEKTEWHRVVVWGKLAELCGQYLGKGRQVYVEGRLQTRQWQDKEGQTKYTTEVQAQSIQFLGSAQGEQRPEAGASSGGSGGYRPAASASGRASGSQGSDAAGGMGAGPSSSDVGDFERNANSVMTSEPSFTEDDIPF